MFFRFATFNYRSDDLAAEERNYLNHHVALGKSLPGVRLYYTSRLLQHRGRKPEATRAVLIGFDNAEAFAAAFRSKVAAELAADGKAHMKDIRMLEFDGEVIVPFDARRAGQECFVMAAEFNLEASGGLEAAENRYRNHHVGIARRLPGLRNYVIGRLGVGGGEKPDRYRMALLAFDSIGAFREAYRSPVGKELVADEEATIRDARVHRLDARVEV
jgi:uncharacterized protein (TIGR02118 family)